MCVVFIHRMNNASAPLIAYAVYREIVQAAAAYWKRLELKHEGERLVRSAS
jgi:hypothetical protein